MPALIAAESKHTKQEKKEKQEKIAKIKAGDPSDMTALLCKVLMGMGVLRKPIRDNPKIFTKSENMFLKSKKIFQIIIFFGNHC